MKGVISGGHELTSLAGQTIFHRGGNAFDAACAAALAGAVCEPTLTGLGGGGFATLHIAQESRNICLDFFVSMPGMDLKHPPREEMEIQVMYGQTPQVYHVGPKSAAVPGFVAGILHMHEQYGILDREQIFAPAIEIAYDGFVLNDITAYNLGFVEKIITHTQTGRKIYAPNGHIVGAGDRLQQIQLGNTLKQLSAEGAECLYRGALSQKIQDWSHKERGLITAQDLAQYRVHEYDPIRARLGEYEVLLPPPPSSGGVLTAFAMNLWDQLATGDIETLAGIDLYLRIMQRTQNVRGREFDNLLYTEGLVDKTLAPETLKRAAEHVRAYIDSPAPYTSPSTTQLSVIDEQGNVVSMTSSTGVGSGEFCEDTGIQLSNMLGESDLFPTDYQILPGQRLTSMTSPCILLKDGMPFLATGSAGSTRIRSAIFQTTLKAIKHLAYLDPAQAVNLAVNSPRIHQEGNIIHVEAGSNPDILAYLKNKGYLVQEWDDKHLYFGGVNMAVKLGEQMIGAGDIRRGGVSIVVD